MAALTLTIAAMGTHLEVRVQPCARRTGILGVHDGAVRVGVAAAPEQGKATAAVVAVLAEALGCRPAQVILVTGPTRRAKRFLIVDLDPDLIRVRLANACRCLS